MRKVNPILLRRFRRGEEQPATQNQPTPPFPQQSQEKPGVEAEMRPRPEYEAPLYRGSGKLEGLTALITGGDSGIGRAVSAPSRAYRTATARPMPESPPVMRAVSPSNLPEPR
jgi:hypothetical protein